MLYYFLGKDAEGEFHLLEIYHGGVIVEIVYVRAHEYSKYG